MNVDTLTMLYREGDVKQTTIFNVSFHFRTNFEKSCENSVIQFSVLRAESVVECTPVFHLLMDVDLSVCTFPRPSIVVKYD